MKYINNFFNELGIIFSYVVMLFMAYYFEWEPFGIFVYYLIEITVLLLVYVLLRLREVSKNTKINKKAQPIANILIGIIPLLLIQYLIVGFISVAIDPNESFIEKNLLMTKEVLFAFCSLTFVYLLKAIQMIKIKDRLLIFQNNFLFKVIALSMTNFLGLILVIGFEMTSLLTVLTIMTAIRIGLVIYLGKTEKLM
ncbi:hypothetical protein [Brumimicrobium sp.]|uniref:hypothetical protein n=1 Tax=Brumimicrobium sp. TaxID=2029867 RepID=UPI003A8DC5F3